MWGYVYIMAKSRKRNRKTKRVTYKKRISTQMRRKRYNRSKKINGGLVLTTIGANVGANVGQPYYNSQPSQAIFNHSPTLAKDEDSTLTMMQDAFGNGPPKNRRYIKTANADPERNRKKYKTTDNEAERYEEELQEQFKKMDPEAKLKEIQTHPVAKFTSLANSNAEESNSPSLHENFDSAWNQYSFTTQPLGTENIFGFGQGFGDGYYR